MRPRSTPRTPEGFLSPDLFRAAPRAATATTLSVTTSPLWQHLPGPEPATLFRLVFEERLPPGEARHTRVSGAAAFKGPVGGWMLPFGSVTRADAGVCLPDAAPSQAELYNNVDGGLLVAVMCPGQGALRVYALPRWVAACDLQAI